MIHGLVRMINYDIMPLKNAYILMIIIRDKSNFLVILSGALIQEGLMLLSVELLIEVKGSLAKEGFLLYI